MRIVKFAIKSTIALCYFSLFATQLAQADLVPGLISDFEDGTLQGWATPNNNTLNIPNGGPLGTGDNFLQISPASAANRLAVFNTGPSTSGNISPLVTSISLDMMRPVGDGDMEMRLVLFGPGTTNRWTSTLSQVVTGDGVWRNFTFSVLEADLTQVLGTGSYSDLTTMLDRVMFRHDSAAPSATGTTNATGTIGADNITANAIPEPYALSILAVYGLGLALSRRRETGI